jgi:predicted small lipoprotein YifL
MRRAPLALLAAAALAALQGCGGPLLFAELQVSSVRVTLPSQSFPASDTTNPADWCSASQTVPPCIQLTLQYDIAGQIPVLNEPNVTYDLRLSEVGMALSATAAGTDLSGVEQVTITVLADPADPTSGVVVASYARPPGAGTPTTISVSGNPNLDLAPYVTAGHLPARIELVLDRPTPAFLADVTAGFSLEVKLDYGSLL